MVFFPLQYQHNLEEQFNHFCDTLTSPFTYFSWTSKKFTSHWRVKPPEFHLLSCLNKKFHTTLSIQSNPAKSKSKGLTDVFLSSDWISKNRQTHLKIPWKPENCSLLLCTYKTNIICEGVHVYRISQGFMWHKFMKHTCAWWHLLFCITTTHLSSVPMNFH